MGRFLYFALTKITCSHLHKLLVSLPRETDDSVSYYSGKISSLHSQATTIIVMAIFMTLLGKYSTRFISARGWAVAGWQDGGSHIFRSTGLVAGEAATAQREGSQGRTSSGWASPLHHWSPRTGAVEASGECRLVWGSLWLPCFMNVQCPPHWGHRQWQWQGDRRQENQRRRLGSGGGSQGVPHSAQGDAPPTPDILARGAASADKMEIESYLPQKTNWKEDARKSCFALPYHAADTNMCPVSQYIWQIKENQEDVTCSNFAVLWSPPVL